MTWCGRLAAYSANERRSRKEIQLALSDERMTGRRSSKPFAGERDPMSWRAPELGVKASRNRAQSGRNWQEDLLFVLQQSGHEFARSRWPNAISGSSSISLEDEAMEPPEEARTEEEKEGNAPQFDLRADYFACRDRPDPMTD